MKGTKLLRIGGSFEIIVGVLFILALRGLMGAETAFIGVTEADAADILWGAAGLYGIYIFQIVAGLIGLLFANKKSLLTVIFGLILFFTQLIPFLHLQGAVLQYVIHIVLLIIPYLYLHGAYKNFRTK